MNTGDKYGAISMVKPPRGTTHTSAVAQGARRHGLRSRDTRDKKIAFRSIGHQECAVLGLRLHGTLLPQLAFSRRERRQAHVIGDAWLP